jgi:hypothetical protein
VSLSLVLPLSFLKKEPLAELVPLNLRDLRPQKNGVFPYRTPSRMTFLTDCIRFLFKR